MTKTNTCTIKLLNKQYEIKCPEGQEDNLALAAQKVQEHISRNRKHTSNLDDFKALLLAALDISHELIVTQNDQEQQRQQVTEFISSLENKINKAVGGEEQQTV